LSFPLKFGIESATRNSKENGREYKLNRIYRHELLFYADGIKLMGDKLSIIKTNTDGLECDKKVPFEVITEKSKYLIMLCKQNSEKIMYG